MEREQAYKDAADHYENAWKHENQASAQVGAGGGAKGGGRRSRRWAGRCTGGVRGQMASWRGCDMMILLNMPVCALRRLSVPCERKRCGT